MLLHTVNKSPFEKNSLESCLRFAQADSSILLYEDAVYVALQGTNYEKLVSSALQTHKIYVLTPDLYARGMHDKPLIDGIQSVDYAGFVDLTIAHHAVQAWV
ncbi:sulfurtransferase complex subunit TusB [Beggiatoa leptomitoformis]|uniref:Sulfurtransferase complex subunit TusB n=1 Tax=Beggiatoa leptomitoformis TaxID=288004 RepID=A0A2N9YI46_9GAMM|nr:sulfurtransferase complex subunit TusB [Beggiatoa leptomitoformis]ALG67568.1 sulfurtransferase complex subunit TusB [Beggiatoa leptomitoformis]AUI70202.1 sulfurtransferase complex subunit TusB [Beggiatoa leptomitoformis]